MSDQTKKIEERIVALQTERDQLEVGALQDEQSARDKRARREQVKQDLRELVGSFNDLRSVENAKRAGDAADSARKVAESAARENEALRDESKNLRDELQEKLKAVDEILNASRKANVEGD